MRKTVAIILAILVLLTGIHVTIASHFCCGQLAAVKISFAGKNASCGMEGDASSALPVGRLMKAHCCTNDLSVLSVDQNYSPSSVKNIDTFQKATLLHGALFTGISNPLVSAKNLCPVHSPPGFYLTSAVELEEICVFRI